MRVNTTAFFAFLAIAACLYRRCADGRTSVYVLCACNLIFYASFSIRHVPILLFVSFVSYVTAILAENRNEGGGALKVFLIVTANLAVLLFFKYAAAITGAADRLFGSRLRGTVQSLAWPLGLSFYTFSALGYVLDVYMGKTRANRDPIRHFAFVGFFPVISSGPIMRYPDFSSRTDRPRKLDYDDIIPGMLRMLWGLEKKLVVADGIGKIVDSIYSSWPSMPGPFLLLAALMYTMQIYCDFSGYSDIAVGAAKVMGIDVKENFQRPFLARTYSDFWSRWHISLTGWFKDYLFTPMAFTWPQLGSFSLFIIYPISGIWHGAGLSYVIWGVLNGAMLVFARKTAKKRRKLARDNPFYRNPLAKHVIQSRTVYLLFSFTLIFFRLTDIRAAFGVLSGLFGGWGRLADVPGTVALLKAVGIGRVSVTVLALSLAILLSAELAEEKRKEHISRIINGMPVARKVAVCYILILLIMFFGNTARSAYIYNAF